MPSASGIKTRVFQVTGMSCAACSSRVEKAVSGTAGVAGCSVNLLTGDLRVEGTAEDSAVILAVEKAGYGCSAINGTETAGTPAAAAQTDPMKLRKRFRTSLLLLIPLMYLSMGIQMLHLPVPGLLAQKPLLIGFLQFLAASAVLLFNRSFFINGWKGAVHKAPNMDTLVALGAGISWIWSAVKLCGMCSLLTPGIPSEEAYKEAGSILKNLYFESAAMIPVMISLGKYLEAGARKKTTDAVMRLKDLRPRTAHLITDEGEVTVTADRLSPGDVFSVRPGEAVPADGWIRLGSSYLDESMLTGESRPVKKQASESGMNRADSSRVYAASINRTGYLECVCEKSSRDSVLSQIIQMVTDAAATKAPAAKLADRAAGFFVPAVITVSFLTFLLWILSGTETGTALTRAVSVLVVSCPCALGLATPVAVMTGSGVGAKYGILFKNAEALELTGKIRTAVFDKTGTVTEGRYSVTDVIPAEDSTAERLLGIAVSIEALSEHPLAEAITDYGRRHHVEAEAVTQFLADGSSVRGMSKKGLIVAGGRRSAEIAGVPESVLQSWEKTAEQKTREGKTAVYFVCGGKPEGIICCADQIRPEAKEAVDQLKKLGLAAVLLSGDHRETVQTVADSTGFDKTEAEVFPVRKAEVIRELQKNGTVLMAGDGINDAPALTAADIGIAVASGTDIAMDAADIVLMKSVLTDIPAAIRLSRKTLSLIRQNLFWAFFYNLLCIPVAAGLLVKPFGIELNPMICAAAMSLSSIFVVTNALRLNRFSPYTEEGENRKVSQAESEAVHKEEKKTVEIAVKGMMCPHCEARVKTALEQVEGVKEVRVSFEKGTAEIEGNADRKLLLEAIRNAGYEV